MSVPTISGTPQVGQTLTAVTGDIQSPVTLQWNSGGTAIAGATGATYVPGAADVGKAITVSVNAVSPPTAAVGSAVPMNTSPPTFTGTAQVGQTLTGTSYGTWTNNPTSYAVQWKRSGTAIPGATGTSYVLVAADVGSTITASVIASNAAGASAPATTAPSATVIDIAPTNSSVPTISGIAQVGQTLTASAGTWTHNPTSFSYQWNRAGSAIAGAIASTYVPVTADVGSTLTVSVTATNSGGSSAPATSAATSAVVPAAAAAFPGQPGNPVGHTAAPGYPGFLTPTSGPFLSGTAGNPRVYSFLDFDGGTTGFYLGPGEHDITFIGCRFQSNNTTYNNIALDGAVGITFSYCSIVPRVALVTAPPNAAWPSAGAGAGVIQQPQPLYQIPASKCYQYGANLSTYGTGGSFTIDHCDIWGGQNMITLYGTIAKIIINNCWIHDFADSAGGVYHQDGPGYLNAAVGPTNVEITNNTIAGIANGNLIAFQGSTSGSNNLKITGNYIGGGGSYAVTLQDTNNITFTDNVFGTDIPWEYGPLYANYTTKFRAAGNTWARNKLNVRSGSSPYPGSVLQWTAGQNGQFLWPDSTLHTTDF